MKAIYGEPFGKNEKSDGQSTASIVLDVGRFSRSGYRQSCYRNRDVRFAVIAIRDHG